RLAAAAERAVAVAIELVLPLVEQVVRDALDGVDALAHLLGALLAALVGLAQAVVAVFELAPALAGDGLELLERVAELFLRLALALFRAPDAPGQELALLDPDLLEHGVVGLLAAG